MRLVCRASCLNAIDQKPPEYHDFSRYWQWLTRPAPGIIRLMPKECSACRTVGTDEDGFCDACGARSWRGAPNQQLELILLNWFSVLVMLGLIVFSYWFLVWRVPLK